MRKFSTRELTLAAAIAAVYAALTLSLPIPQYGGIQIRFAEALAVLPFFLPAAIPGLTVGCLIANLLGSPFVLDWALGTLATLLAALWTARLRRPLLAPLPPVVCNAVIVGAEISWFSTLEGAAFLPAFALNATAVGLGELAACCLLGGALLAYLPKIPYFVELIPPQRLREISPLRH